MYLNLHISSKNSSAASWQFFICEILMIIVRSFTLYFRSDSRVFSFCSALSGERTVIRTSSKQGMRNLEFKFFRLFFWHRAANMAPWISNLRSLGWLSKKSTKSTSGNGWSASRSPQNSIFITRCFTSLAHCSTELTAPQFH
uniref:Uncharacterized protein n=1 Tax=Zea mays TaxID=4577 RepID=C0PCP7_MAIZE|nr:unknown [Zea mays]